MPAFISRKFEDVGIYSAICLALDGAKVERWDPAKMSRGESLADQLRDAIRKCECCVFIATRRSIDSAWCLAELGAFWGAGKRVFLYLGEPDLDDAMLPPQFKGDLKVNTAQELVDAIRATTDGNSVALPGMPASAEILILNDRTHLYEKTAEVLRAAKWQIIDTTWGPIARTPDKSQAGALAGYLWERNRARDRGVECHELLSPKGREVRIAAAKEECKKGNFLIKIIDPAFELPYMPDIVVADTEHVIISNVSASQAGKFKYLYVRSEGLAQLFNDWFWECWGKLPGEEFGRRSDGHTDGPLTIDPNVP